MNNALEFMQDLVDRGICEDRGKNRSLVIDSINRDVGNAMGAPYCAAAVSYCFRKCANMPGSAFPYSGGSQAIMRAFRSMGKISQNPQDILEWHGALGGWTLEEDPRHGHIFMIKGRLQDANGKVTHVLTLEANTSVKTMGRDGEGFYELKRPVSSLDWFLDCSGISGGSWWSPKG